MQTEPFSSSRTLSLPVFGQGEHTRGAFAGGTWAVRSRAKKLELDETVLQDETRGKVLALMTVCMGKNKR